MSVTFSLYLKLTWITSPSQTALTGVLFPAAKSHALWTSALPNTILSSIKKDVTVALEKSIGGTKGLFTSSSIWSLLSKSLHPEKVLYFGKVQTSLIGFILFDSLSILST